MKKLLGIIMVVLITIGGIGCSKEAINQKTEEELRAKLSTKDIIDIKDKEVLKSFITDNYKEAENADFENMVIKYHDFTKDGIEDVVCYFDNDSYFLDKPIFISQKDSMLYEVPNDMSFQYIQEVDFDNDFIFYITTSGGSGISDKYKNFYVYNGIEIKYTEASILIEGHSSGPGFDVERYGEVVFDKENNYKNFTYKEVQTGSEPYEKEFRYVYDAKQQKFDIEEIASSNNEGQNVPTKIAGCKVKTYEIDGDKLNLELEGTIYNVHGRLEYSDYYEGYVVIIEENAEYEGFKIELGGESMYVSPPSGTFLISKDDVVKAIDGEMAMLVTKGVKLSVECNITDYSFKAAAESSYGIDGIVDITYWEAVEEESALEESTLSGFEPEMLYSNDEKVYIDYSDYFLVVVPMQETKNAYNLSSRFIEVTKTGYEFPLKFSVFGELESLEIEYYENSFDEPKIIL